MHTCLYRFSRRAMFFLVLTLLSGCARLPAGTIKQIESPVIEKEVVTVPPAEIEPPPSAEYIIGPNDVLSISVNGRSDFSYYAPNTNMANNSGRVQGSRVDGGGNIHLPLAGAVPVAGLTLSQAEARIKESLREYLKDPWVVVEIAEYQSHPLYLLGQFKNASTFYMDRPLTLLQGISLGKGFDPSANLRGARLTRANRVIPVDIYDLLTRGDQRQNIWLKDGDTIYIPDSKTQYVFVFGAVKKPGPVPVSPEGLNMAQAIASADLRDIGYDLGHVRIIRSLSATRGEMIVVDFDRVMRGDALPFQLIAGRHRLHSQKRHRQLE